MRLRELCGACDRSLKHIKATHRGAANISILMQLCIFLSLVTLFAAVLPVLCNPRVNASTAAPAACIAVSQTPTASRRRALVQLYSDDDPVMLQDMSAAVTEIMAARASRAEGREWRLCVQWAGDEEEQSASEIQEITEMSQRIGPITY